MRTLLSGQKNVPGLILTGLSIVVFLVGLFGSADFRDISRWFPMGVSIAGIALALGTLLWELGIVRFGVSDSFEADASGGDGESSMTPLRGFLVYMAWVAALMLGLMVFGTLIAVFVWLFFFFRFRSKEGWVRSLLYSLAAVAVIVILTSILHLFVPIGWLLPSGDWIPQVNIRF